MGNLHIGIDLGGQSIKGGLVLVENGDYKIINRKTIPTDKSMTQIDVLRAIRDVAIALSQPGVISIGVGSPGIADVEAKTVQNAHNVPGFSTNIVPIGNYLEHELQISAYVGNDAKVAGLAEGAAGAAKGLSLFHLFTLGTGLGGATIKDGKIYIGPHKTAGEMHWPMILDGGYPCTCGIPGCSEGQTNTNAINHMIAEAMDQNRNSLLWDYESLKDLKRNPDLNKVKKLLEVVDARMLDYALTQNDSCANQILDRYARNVAAASIGINNPQQFQAIVYGGGLSKIGGGKPLLERIQIHFDKMDFAGNLDPSKRTQLKLAALGNDAGIIGAAALGVTKGAYTKK